MSQENVEIVQRVYAGLNRIVGLRRAGQEWETAPEWVELFQPDVVLDDVVDLPGSAAYSGLDEVKRWFQEGSDLFPETTWVPRDLRAGGPHVVVAAHIALRGGGSGVPLEIDVTHVFTVHDGRIAHIRAFFDRQEALDAVGLSE